MSTYRIHEHVPGDEERVLHETDDAVDAARQYVDLIHLAGGTDFVPTGPLVNLLERGVGMTHAGPAGTVSITVEP